MDNDPQRTICWEAGGCGKKSKLGSQGRVEPGPLRPLWYLLSPLLRLGLHLTFLDLAVGIELACPHLPGGSHTFLGSDFLEPSLLPIPDVCHCEWDVTNLQGRVSVSHSLIPWFQNPSRWATVRSW